MLAGYTGNATTAITKRWRLLVSNKKILKIIKYIYVVSLRLIDKKAKRQRGRYVYF